MELEKLLLEKLTGAKFKDFHVSMGITTTRRTQMFNRPGSMSLQEIGRLHSILRPHKISYSLLINEYKCGYNTLTISEAEILTSQDQVTDIIHQ